MQKVCVFRIVLGLLLLVSTVPLTGCIKKPIETRQVNVVFRFDDFSARSSTDLEQHIIRLFAERKLPVTFSVIPFVCSGDIHDPTPQDLIPLSPDKAEILKTAQRQGILDIALHGYSHQTDGQPPYAEFAHLDYAHQVRKLSEGKKFLEDLLGASVTTFVPPWNKYDLNTLQALETLGFTTLSANRKGPGSLDSGLFFLPATCGLKHLADAISAARASSEKQPVVVVLFHEYDFKEINARRGRFTVDEFAALLDWVASQQDVRSLSISQAVETINDLSAERFLLAGPD